MTQNTSKKRIVNQKLYKLWITLCFLLSSHMICNPAATYTFCLNTNACVLLIHIICQFWHSRDMEKRRETGRGAREAERKQGLKILIEEWWQTYKEIKKTMWGRERQRRTNKDAGQSEDEWQWLAGEKRAEWQTEDRIKGKALQQQRRAQNIEENLTNSE